MEATSNDLQSSSRRELAERAAAGLYIANETVMRALGVALLEALDALGRPPEPCRDLDRAERIRLDELVAFTKGPTVEIPRLALRAVLEALDGDELSAETWSAIAQEMVDTNADQLGAARQTYAELDEAHAATLGQLCGAEFDLVDARSRAQLLEELLFDLQAWVQSALANARELPRPLSRADLDALVRIRVAIQRLGVEVSMDPDWGRKVFEALEAPELDQARELREAPPAGYDFLDTAGRTRSGVEPAERLAGAVRALIASDMSAGELRRALEELVGPG